MSLVFDGLGPGVGLAQGWPYAGWGSPYVRVRHRKPRSTQPAPKADAPVAAVDVPMPIPRPRFPADAPIPAPLVPPKIEPPKTESPKTESPKTVSPKAVSPKIKPLAPPSVAPSGARLGEAPGQPEADDACLGRLKARNVSAAPVVIGPQPDPRCTVVDAVRLGALVLPDGHKVDFPDAPTIACTTADAFTLYVRDLLVPLAKGTYGAPVASVWTGPGLECRSRDHIFGAKLSAHGQGLAVDIAQLKLADGHLIEVGQPKTPADQGFETAARAAGCGYFHTVLGPGSDSYHRTHWHFDLEVRGAKGDSKYCK